MKLDRSYTYKLCDDLLAILYNSKDEKIYRCEGKYKTEHTDIFKTLGAGEEYAETVTKILRDSGLIYELKPKHYYDDKLKTHCGLYQLELKENGIEFAKFHSFVKNYEEEQKQELRESIEQEKAEQDLMIGKWLLKTKWWPHIATVASIIIAVASVIYAYKSYELSKQTDGSTVNKEELQMQLNVLQKKHDTEIQKLEKMYNEKLEKISSEIKIHK